MGRKTFESLPNGPLKDRINIIISINSFDELYNKYKDNDNIFVFKTISDAYNFSKNNSKRTIWVIGGSQIYEEAVKLNLINKLYVTKLDTEYKCDTFLGPNTINYIKKYIFNNH
jgi:dihydrofolate reductase